MPNIKIKSLGDRYASAGLFLEEGANLLCPELKPGQVVSVAENHPVFESNARDLIELTNAEVTRRYSYDTLQEAKALTMAPEKAAEAAAMIATSMELTAATRADNQARAQHEQELADPIGDNAYVRKTANPEEGPLIAPEQVKSTKRSRRRG